MAGVSAGGREEVRKEGHKNTKNIILNLERMIATIITQYLP